MSSYKVIKNLNINVHYFSGKTTLTDIKAQMRKICEEPDYSKFHNTITDLRDANFEGKVNEVYEFVDFISNEMNVLARKKVVYITNNPKEVALTTLFINAVRKSNINVLVCSTAETAVKFIDTKGFDVVTLKQIMEEMQN